LVQLATGNIEESVRLAGDFLDHVNKENKDLKSISSEQLLNLGVTFNEAMDYSKAIDFLNKSIENDPSNKEAYFQRAVANLEMGLFDNAIIDFLASEKGKDLAKVESKVSVDFQDAFLNSSETVTNFIPSLYSFAYANTFHPIDSLTNYANSCYALMGITAEYLKEVDWSRLKEPIDTPLSYELSSILLEPGLNHLYEKMDGLSPAEQGQLLGHAIGAYGTDFVAGLGLIKGITNSAKLANACKAARDAGRIYELETLAQSASASESIIVEATERAAIRETIVQGAKSRRVVIKSANDQFHIMQKKHAWDKLIQLSGNAEEDIRKVVSLLEEHGVLSEKFLAETENVTQSIIKNEYEIIIGEHRVRAVFNESMLMKIKSS